jgi:probable rRNA maturation factor
MSRKSVMFQVDWSSRSKLRGPGEGSLGELIVKLRDKLSPNAEGVSVSYVDDRLMRKLNLQHRGIKKTTDVLSFPSKPDKGAVKHLGDIVISLPVADKMAKKMGVSRRRQVETLLIHGFLHLCGFDHEKDKGEMLNLQAQLEAELLGEDPLPMVRKRGRKPGSKVKVMRDGTRVVVTGRAAKAQIRKEEAKKEKKAAKKAARKSGKKTKVEVKPKRGPGRPRKVQAAGTKKTLVKRVAPRRKKTPASRTGILS